MRNVFSAVIRKRVYTLQFGRADAPLPALLMPTASSSSTTTTSATASETAAEPKKQRRKPKGKTVNVKRKKQATAPQESLHPAVQAMKVQRSACIDLLVICVD